MRNKKNKENILAEESPQLALEKIIKTEIEVAHRISDAKENAEKRFESARDAIAPLKEQIISEARIERDETFSKRIEGANERSAEKLALAKEKSAQFSKKGTGFMAEAVQMVIDYVLFNDRDA